MLLFNDCNATVNDKSVSKIPSLDGQVGDKQRGKWPDTAHQQCLQRNIDRRAGSETGKL